MPQARYWRLRFDRTQGGVNAAVGELQLRATPGGADWSSLGTPISSADFDINHVAAKAFDGTAATRWAAPNGSATRNNHWVGIALPAGTTRDCAEIVYTSRSDCCTDQGIKEGCLEWSNNGWLWFRDWTLYNVPTWTLGQTRTFTRPAPTNQPYWRLYGMQTNSTVQAFSEIEFRTTPGGAQAATGGTAIATSVNGPSWVAANAFDGNPATAWASAGNDFDPAWVGYQWPAPITIVQAYARARTDSNPEQTPQRISLDASPDGMVWVVAQEWGTMLWTLGQAYLLTIPDGTQELVARIAPSALTGAPDKLLLGKVGPSALTGSDTRLAVGKVGAGVLTGSGTREAVGRIAPSVLTGAQPYLSVGKIGVSLLIQPVLRPRNGPVQIF